MRIDEILPRLQGVRQNDSGWSARCPAHEDQRASLSVTAADNGAILLHCHAGCDIKTVVQKLGLKMRDLAPPNQHRGNGRPQIVASYDYSDEAGKLLFQAVRFSPKDFNQRRPDGKGGWTWNLQNTRRVLYRLPGLLAADPDTPIYIAEGEKDADRLVASGVVATTNPMGAGSWNPEYSDCLQGRPVVILPDNDSAGCNHAQKVAASLQGKAASVKVVELPGLPPGGDVSDFLDAGGTAEQLAKLVEAAPEWQPAADTPITKSTPAVTSFPQTLPLTDTGLAERFAQQHGHEVRYCHPWGKWLVWDGTRWALDDEGHLQQLAKATARAILKEAAAESDAERFKDLLRFAASAESAHRRKAMLLLAQSEPPIPVLPRQLDTDNWLLNCPNGTLNLHSGELREHRREDLITKLCPTPYDPEAKAARWEQFLVEIFAGSNRLVEFAQRLTGYCLTGSTADHILPILYGKGSNGKSTFLTALRHMLGSDYSAEAPSDLLMLKRNEQHPTSLALLFGKRLVVAVETEQDRRLAESLVKQLSGGDAIACRKMREDFWEYRPTHKILLACNHKPRIQGTDWAMWRRVKLIPFIVTIGPEEEDKHLDEKLNAEARGVLAWAVEGCRVWQQTGLEQPAEIVAATAAYRSDEDSFAKFLDERCVLGPDYTVKAADLLTVYREWSGDKRVSGRRLSEILTEKGYESFKSSSVWYRGIGLPIGG